MDHHNPLVQQARDEAAARHHCKGLTDAHEMPKGTTRACTCGRVWRVTKKHYGPHRICGCGWEPDDPARDISEFVG